MRISTRFGQKFKLKSIRKNPGGMQTALELSAFLRVLAPIGTMGRRCGGIRAAVPCLPLFSKGRTFSEVSLARDCLDNVGFLQQFVVEKRRSGRCFAWTFNRGRVSIDLVLGQSLNQE